jgi:hypothetical protein
LVARTLRKTIIILVKFKEGAWMTVSVVPGLVLLMAKINAHC